MIAASIPCAHLSDPMLSDEEARAGVVAVLMPCVNGSATASDPARPPVALCHTCVYIALRVSEGKAIVADVPGGVESRRKISAALDAVAPAGTKRLIG